MVHGDPMKIAMKAVIRAGEIIEKNPSTPLMRRVAVGQTLAAVLERTDEMTGGVLFKRQVATPGHPDRLLLLKPPLSRELGRECVKFFMDQSVACEMTGCPVESTVLQLLAARERWKHGFHEAAQESVGLLWETNDYWGDELGCQAAFTKRILRGLARELGNYMKNNGGDVSEVVKSIITKIDTPPPETEGN